MPDPERFPHTVHLPDTAATERLAGLIAPALQAGDLIALDGPLGSGKTTFVRALVAACGGQEALVASPSYGLLHQYECRLPMIHIDAYRLQHSEQLDGLGLDEVVDESITCIEWAQRMVGLTRRFRRAWLQVWAHGPDGGRDVCIDAPEPLALDELHGARTDDHHTD